jgi:hypothetical protein
MGYRPLGRISSLRRAALLDSARTAFSTGGYPNKRIDFGKGFRLPKIDKNRLVLELMNKHPLDLRIRFDEEAHKYYFDNKLMSKSVTELVESYFEKFDPDVVAPLMVKSKNWPREGYMNEKTGEPMTVEEIKKKWEDFGEQARNKGTWMHHHIECLLNNLVCSRQ